MKKTVALWLCVLCLAGNAAGCGRDASKDAASVPETTALAETTKTQERSAGQNTESVMQNGASAEQSGKDALTEKSVQGEDEEEEHKEAEGENAPLRPNAAGWEEKLYQDRYLSYQIPESWEQNASQSNEEMMFAFFQSKEPEVKYPSNVNVQITQLNSGEHQNGIDYGDKEIQEEFHQFLITEMGLPAEAADGTFTVTETKGGVYIYSLGFERKAMDNTTAHQTVYLPMNLEHSIVIWATDFHEGAAVSADDAAKRICETLKIKK